MRKNTKLSQNVHFFPWKTPAFKNERKMNDSIFCYKNRNTDQVYSLAIANDFINISENDELRTENNLKALE